MKSIVLPAGTEHVPYGDLAQLIANALWPDDGSESLNLDIKRGGTRINLADELAQAVKTGALALKDPLTFGPHTFPIGDALNRALVSVDDLREFVSGRGLSILFQFTDSEAGTTSTSNMTQAERDEHQRDKHTRHAKGYYTMSEVAQILADTYSLDAAALLKTMKSDYYAGHLTIRSRATDAPALENHTLRDFYDWMFPDDIRAMLAHWKWSREFPFSAQETAPAKEAATPAPMEKVVFSAPPSLCSISARGTPMFDGDGYEQYLSDKAERNAKGRYTMAEAAQVLADAHVLNPANFLEHRMMPAFDSDKLRVIDPTDGGPVRGRKCNAYSDEVTPSGVDAWLEAEGFADHVRWPLSAVQQLHTLKEIANASVPPQPDPLPTKTIGELFDGIEFTQDRWIKNIGTAAWLEDANRGKGERGGASATWCPLTVARLVYARQKSSTMTEARDKRKTLNALNSRFRTNPVLKPWKDAWDDYYSMFTDTEEA